MVLKPAKPKPLRVLPIGFSPVVRAGLQAILATDPGIEVMGDSADGREALPQMKKASAQGRPIDVVLTETRSRLSSALRRRCIRVDSGLRQSQLPAPVVHG
jgi:DNA-binding NarL/FixJ family response regulator